MRFVEVVVNGPKSWSLAAELHPDIAAAYDAAQDSAAGQIIGWLAHTRPPGSGRAERQVAVPVEQSEAVTVRHYTSRAGDPHRHLHLQINARVFAAGKWRGLHTVGVRDSLEAINGIGHAAVTSDPEFRAALAAHGFTLDETGEIEQLAPYVGAFTKRAAQIAAQLDRYEADWRTEHPGDEPGPRLRRAWDARAWAEDRPDKVIPRSGDELRQPVAGRARASSATATGTSRSSSPRYLPGALDRDAAVDRIVTRSGAARSAWNAADVRGQVEQLLARARHRRRRRLCGASWPKTSPPAPLTDAFRCCNERLRPSTCARSRRQHVLDVERDIVGRLALRGAEPARDLERARCAPRRDDRPRSAAAALVGDGRRQVADRGRGGGRCRQDHHPRPRLAYRAPPKVAA